jgi:hypothetical protein
MLRQSYSLSTLQCGQAQIVAFQRSVEYVNLGRKVGQCRIDCPLQPGVFAFQRDILPGQVRNKIAIPGAQVV